MFNSYLIAIGINGNLSACDDIRIDDHVTLHFKCPTLRMLVYKAEKAFKFRLYAISRIYR